MAGGCKQVAQDVGSSTPGKATLYLANVSIVCSPLEWLHSMSGDQKKQSHTEWYFQVFRPTADKEDNCRGIGIPEVTYGCETWTLRKEGRKRIEAFEMWTWRKFFRMPWTDKRTHTSFFNEINFDEAQFGL
ncbi:hypothetical protein LAZ67_4003869 [Cordylochernes scorpioides]|uniref:Uncharacterized protein n=1 Tax=Cordylochernes scorpioides TaxID=51811 RepID=A0ABY6KE32_9ARAC|nr:hypothetical protein LAZ67_4003869 [Cordylochernes scorpioides]